MHLHARTMGLPCCPAQGEHYKVGPGGTPTMLNSLMYKACYHDFGSVSTMPGQVAGFDRVRNTPIGEYSQGRRVAHVPRAATPARC